MAAVVMGSVRNPGPGDGASFAVLMIGLLEPFVVDESSDPGRRFAFPSTISPISDLRLPSWPSNALSTFSLASSTLPSLRAASPSGLEVPTLPLFKGENTTPAAPFSGTNPRCDTTFGGKYVRELSEPLPRDRGPRTGTEVSEGERACWR